MDDSVREQLRRLEERLLHPEVRRDRAAVSALLADEFVEFGSSGRVFDKEQVLALLASETPYPIQLVDFEARMLAPSVALVLYRSIRPEGPPQPGTASRRSSIWVQRNGCWQMLFHQGTPIPSPAP